MAYLRLSITLHSVPSLFLLGFLLTTPLRAQETASHVYRALVQDAHHEEPLAGVNVSVEGTTIGAATGSDGHVTVTGIPAGRQTIVFSFIGFETTRRTFTFPLDTPNEVQVVLLEEAHGELEEIAVSATRTSRTISDQATRIEIIAGEEIDEKISMEPANISMLLNESPGITVQQTSAVSGGASIRIQGLDGRYTQILKDGFPLYGGFSGGLSLLQVPPLDLQQVEVIKGPSSTLYGGDAIAGLVNLVSKGPAEAAAWSLLANATSAGGYDLGGFYRARGEHLGMTFLASGNVQRAYDPDDDAFSNLPDTRRLTVSPKLFYYPAARTTLSIGLTGTFEDREGGDLDVLEHGPTADRTFFEQNKSTRLTSQARLDHGLGAPLHEVFGGEGMVTLKNSVSLFDRTIEVPEHRFDGQQLATYSEASLLLTRETHDFVVGLDLRTDAFREHTASAVMARDYSYASAGAFAQDTWDVSERVVVEAGLRADYHNTFGLFALPKVSLRYRMTEHLSARAGGGLGYKAPTVFLEPSEERAFRGVVPLDDGVRAETSQGGSIDVTYQTLLFDRLTVSLNQAFYFTDLKHPLVPVVAEEGSADANMLRFESVEGAIQTRALETNAKLSLSNFKLFLGYVYLNARADYGDVDRSLPLTPEHKTYTVLVYEKHGTGRIGLEAYFTGPQTLADGTRTEGYWITGVMAERRFGPARLFLNFENFLDTKQSNYAPLVLGPRSNPRFAEIWAPMDGFIINGGVKYTL
ncbi:MAG TPA: TonB-dependent receptor [Rhodothermales bacterium]|nr:TonB-dependent receptor [Rhodothermales bacterium]